MHDLYGIQCYGKTNIQSRFGVCDGCKKFTDLNSYETARFLQLFHIPLIPIGLVRIQDKCARCGFHTTLSKRKYKKTRAKEFSTMMQALKELPEYPDHVINGLKTLMAYNEKHWFTGMANQYRRLFENHVQFQVVIAEGLCRFGDYPKSEEACLKAIELEAGKRAEELLKTCRTIKAAADKKVKHEELEADKLHLILPYLATPSLVALITSLFMIQNILASRVRPIWLINGSENSYSIHIDASQHKLAPYEQKKLKLRFGDHPIALDGENVPTNISLTNLNVSSYSTLAPENILVINPDTMAILVKETLSANNTNKSYLFGKPSYTILNIDYPFIDFPSSGLLRKKTTSGTRVTQLVKNSYSEMADYLSQNNQSNALAHYARTALTLDPSIPESKMFLPYALSNLTPAESLHFLKIGLKYQPILPTWHHFYQAFSKSYYPSHDLQMEYAHLCKSYPHEPQYLYLLGRVVKNRPDAMLLFEQSEKSNSIAGLGYYEVAKHALLTGNFTKANEFAEKALHKDLTNPDFKDLLNQTLLATEQYAQLLAEIQTTQPTEKNKLDLALKEVSYLTLLGRHNEAANYCANFASENENHDPNYKGIRWGSYLEAARYYTVGNMNDYLSALIYSRLPSAQYEKALHTGNTKEALKLRKESTEQKITYLDYLTLYCVASSQNDLEAKMLLNKALQQFPTTTAAQKKAKELFEHSQPFNKNSLIQLELPANEKRIICVALGFKYPNKKKVCFHIAQKFNYLPTPPKRLIKKWTKQI